MIEWSDTDLLIRDAVREFIDKEIRPNVDALESGEITPYPIIRKLFSQFGLDVLAAEAVKNDAGPASGPGRSVHGDGESASSGGAGLGGAGRAGVDGGHRDQRARRRQPGHVAAMGVSLGPGRGDDHGPRHAGAEGALATAAGDDGKGRGVGDHRARFRLGCLRRNEDLRQTRR